MGIPEVILKTRIGLELQMTLRASEHYLLFVSLVLPLEMEIEQYFRRSLVTALRAVELALFLPLVLPQLPFSGIRVTQLILVTFDVIRHPVRVDVYKANWTA